MGKKNKKRRKFIFCGAIIIYKVMLKRSAWPYLNRGTLADKR